MGLATVMVGRPVTSTCRCAGEAMVAG